MFTNFLWHEHLPLWHRQYHHRSVKLTSVNGIKLPSFNILDAVFLKRCILNAKKKSARSHASPWISPASQFHPYQRPTVPASPLYLPPKQTLLKPTSYILDVYASVKMQKLKKIKKIKSKILYVLVGNLHNKSLVMWSGHRYSARFPFSTLYLL